MAGRKMKDSGVEWIGEIPKEWNIAKVKHYFNISRGRVISVFDLVDGGKYPVYSSQTEREGVFGYLDTFDYSGPAITWTTDGYAGTVFLRKGQYNCTNVCGVLQIKNTKIHKVNIGYLVHAVGIATNENRRPDINGHKIMSNEMARLALVVPNIAEQTRIADFLDEKTAEIDGIISDIKKEIETLEEYKKSVITEAVTKGLDKNVEMKDSGVAWIGKIPKHWDMVAVKRIFDVSRGRVISRLELNDNGKYPVYSSQTENEGVFGYLNTFDYSGPAITWTTDGEKAGTVFYREGRYNCTNICGILQVKSAGTYEANIEFLVHAISVVANENKRPDTNGHKIMSNEMARLTLPLPSIHEQVLISQNLKTKIGLTIELLEDKHQQIKTLEQYKKSLIYEYVTGKKEVKQ